MNQPVLPDWFGYLQTKEKLFRLPLKGCVREEDPSPPLLHQPAAGLGAEVILPPPRCCRVFVIKGYWQKAAAYLEETKFNPIA